MTTPTPDDAIMHCVALFPHREDVLTPYLQEFARRFPDFDGQAGEWSEAKSPQTVRYGPVTAGGWNWHLLSDGNGMPEQIADVVAACRISPRAEEAIQDHQSHLMLFLVKAPGLPLPKIQTFCDLAVFLLSLGATVLVWPEGRAAWHRDELQGLDPSRFEPADFGLVVRWNIARSEGSGAGWLRTFGLGQFDLPEIACPLPEDPQLQQQETAHAAKLFEHIPPYLIERNNWLKVGEWIEVFDQTWDVVRWADKKEEQYLCGRYGAMCYVRRSSDLQA